MAEKKTKAYIYTRVSTAMQVEGYSLDAQKERMRSYAKSMDIEIAGEYEDIYQRQTRVSKNDK